MRLCNGCGRRRDDLQAVDRIGRLLCEPCRGGWRPDYGWDGLTETVATTAETVTKPGPPTTEPRYRNAAVSARPPRATPASTKDRRTLRRRYATDADRQRAYRARRQERGVEQRELFP